MVVAASISVVSFIPGDFESDAVERDATGMRGKGGGREEMKIRTVLSSTFGTRAKERNKSELRLAKQNWAFHQQCVAFGTEFDKLTAYVAWRGGLL